MTTFGQFVRERREGLGREDRRRFSLRAVAGTIGVEPSYLSRVERGEMPPPSEQTIKALAEVLGEDPDVLLAMAGKVSRELQEVILARPRLFARVIRELKEAPDPVVERVFRAVRDGEW